MPSERNLHVWFAAVGIVLGFTMMKISAEHGNDPMKLAILVSGALLCVLVPLAALMWTLKREGRLQFRRSVCFAVVLMVVGLLGPSRVDALVPWKFGDIFGLVFWSGFALLCFLLCRNRHSTPRQDQTVHLHPSPGKDIA